MAYQNNPQNRPNSGQGFQNPLMVQTLDVPLEENKPGVFAAYLRFQLKAGDIAAHELDNTIDGRLETLVKIMISCIPNPKVRETIKKDIKDRIKSEVDVTATNEAQGHVIRDIYIDIMGKVSDYMDIYMGGERRNRISFVIPIKEMREVMEKANPEHFKEHLNEDDELHEKEPEPNVISSETVTLDDIRRS